MRFLGFSTGALAKGDFEQALSLLKEYRTTAIEFSALRSDELDPLLDFVTSRRFPDFAHIAFHAPSKTTAGEESVVAKKLRRLHGLGWPIVAHPDCLRNTALWRSFGRQLCIENMDQRKPIGRTCDEMAAVFETFPDASFCFDIGHSHQVDPSMSQARCMLQRFAGKLKQVHFSEVDANSAHCSAGWIARSAFESVLPLIPEQIPVILEAVIAPSQIGLELQSAREFFGASQFAA